MKGALGVIAVTVIAAVIYGILHNQVTARVCLEYFTIGHKRVFASNSPTLHGLYWGVVATWWAGVASGVVIAAGARLGPLPKLSLREVMPCIIGLVAVMALGAFVMGSIGWSLANTYPDAYPTIVRRGLTLPSEKTAAYIACARAHEASYFIGFVGTLVVALALLIRRGLRARLRLRSHANRSTGLQ